MKIIAIVAWVLTALIVILGFNAGATIWFYMEPVVDAVPDPASYYIAVTAGFMALLMSLAVSIGLTVHAARCNVSRSAQLA
ncbi:hypothetical protein AAGW05_05530 [Arthrobacter sp. LAPM80]|uniref:hypothetical protein n=1 Tax=Arthrobacter sp. LAPM80 TaxID=3141788 RepID=UPI00398BB112